MHEMHLKEGGRQPQSSYHAQSSPSTQNAQPSQNTSPPDQSASQPSQQQQQPQQQQPQQNQQGTIQTMRLRQDAPSVTQSQGRSRKRKSPPSADALHPVPPPPPPAAMQHTLPPAHTLVPPPHLPGHVIPPPGYQYPPGDYPAGLPPPHTLAPPPPTDSGQDQRPQTQSSNGTTTTGTSRTLSQSKRAEQNRKAQRAFRERRDQHVKALESRSQLLDAALASADEANRRWEECRALVDQLRIENAALRAALSQSQMLGSGGSSVQPAGSSDENRSADTRVSEGTKGAEDSKE